MAGRSCAAGLRLFSLVAWAAALYAAAHGARGACAERRRGGAVAVLSAKAKSLLPGAGTPRRLRPRRTATLLLALAAGGGASLDAEGDVLEYFKSLDKNGDKKVSEKEWSAMVPPDAPTAEIQLIKSIFFQADVNDDDLLCVAEFEFATFIAQDEQRRKKYESYQDQIPEGFFNAIGAMFDALRSELRAAGQVTFAAVSQQFGRFTKDYFGREPDDETAERLRQLFGRTDITRDGHLNMNELDYLEYALTDSLIQGALQTAGPDARTREETMDYLVEGFTMHFDTNQDGRLDKEEVVSGLERSYARQAEAAQVEGDRYGTLAEQHFATADVDGDGYLNREETKILVGLMTSNPVTES